MESDDQSFVPREGGVVCLPENEVHRIAVSLDQFSILCLDVGRLIACQDPPHLVHGPVDTFHPRRGRDSLGLEVPDAGGLPRFEEALRTSSNRFQASSSLVRSQSFVTA